MVRERHCSGQPCTESAQIYCSLLRAQDANCRNYYLLILFFGLASLYSFLDLQRKQSLQKSQKITGKTTVNGLGYAVVTLFHINLTVSTAMFLHEPEATCAALYT